MIPIREPDLFINIITLNTTMLLGMIFIPLVGSLVLMLIESRKGYDLLIRQISLFFSFLVWILAHVLLAFYFNEHSSLLQYKIYNFIPSTARFGEFALGLDGISLIFILLTAYLVPLAILSTFDTVTHKNRLQLIAILVLESFLILVFSALDLFFFYISFETILIPLFIIIGIQGSTEERVKSSMLLFLYTLFGSFFLLLSLMILFLFLGTGEMIVLKDLSTNLNLNVQKWISLGILLSIAVKSPLVPLHGWLYRAHADSSLAGSILLAGIVLKLATYAYIRILLPLVPYAVENLKPFILVVACFSLIHGSLATMRQVDSKVFIAYSSVGHMAIVIVGLASGTINGLQGSLMLSVAHGLISPALFIFVGGVLYDRYHTRIIRYIRGTGSFMPSFKTWFFLASVGSMAVPSSINWLGEVFSILGAFEVAPISGILASLSVLLGAIYTIWIFNQIVGGHPSPYIALMNDLTKREYTLSLWLIIPAFILGIFPFILTNLTGATWIVATNHIGTY